MSNTGRLSARGRTGRVVLAAWCALSVLQPAMGADGAFTFSLENDTFTGSDNNYTNGLGFAWTTNAIDTYDDGSPTAEWARFWSFLPFVSDEGYRTYASWTLAQEMNTPDDISNPDPPEDDQPYSGVLYVDSQLYARKERWQHAWQLRLGVVGPASQADDVQREFHEISGDDEPLGWDTQLPNEPVVNLGYGFAMVLAEGARKPAPSWRAVALADAGLGNYFTGVGAGLYVEAGWNLVDAFGRTDLRQGLSAASVLGAGPVRGWSVSFFGGVTGYGIVHYLPLDGTLFSDSRSVDTEPLVGMGSVGLSVRRGRLVLNYARSYFTKTFSTERENPEFGTVSISWYF